MNYKKLYKLKYFVCFFSILSFISISGCDLSKKDFDRHKAFRESPTIFAPTSHYIKKQTIKTEADGELESIVSYQYTKSGDSLSGSFEFAKTKVLGYSFEYDYENNKLNLYSNLYRVNIVGGDVIEQDHGKIVKFHGYNDNSIFKNNLEFKLINKEQDNNSILSIVEVGSIKDETIQYFEEKLLVKSVGNVYRDGHLVINSIRIYSYNEEGILNSNTVNITMLNNPEVSSKTYFSDYNAYGDWTKAVTFRENQGSPRAVISTREIEYW